MVQKLRWICLMLIMCFAGVASVLAQGINEPAERAGFTKSDWRAGHTFKLAATLPVVFQQNHSNWLARSWQGERNAGILLLSGPRQPLFAVSYSYPSFLFKALDPSDGGNRTSSFPFCIYAMTIDREQAAQYFPG